MELTIKDRLYLPGILSKEGNYQEYNLKKGILAKIDISEQERKEVNLRKNDQSGYIEWDVEKDTPIEPLFTHEEMEYLKTSCEKLSDQTLPDEMWSTVEAIFNAIQQQ